VILRGWRLRRAATGRSSSFVCIGCFFFFFLWFGALLGLLQQHALCTACTALTALHAGLRGTYRLGLCCSYRLGLLSVCHDERALVPWKLRRHTRVPVHTMLSATAPCICTPADTCTCSLVRVAPDMHPATSGRDALYAPVRAGTRIYNPCRPCCTARLPWLGHARMQSQAQVRTAARHGDAPEPQWAATRVCGSPHHHYSPHQLSYTTSTNPGALAKVGDAHAGACAVTPLTALTRPSPSYPHSPVLAV